MKPLKPLLFKAFSGFWRKKASEAREANDFNMLAESPL
jgi:hypothetical protein